MEQLNFNFDADEGAHNEAAVMEEARYFIVLKDFAELVEKFGAGQVLLDMADFHEEAYNEISEMYDNKNDYF